MILRVRGVIKVMLSSLHLPAYISSPEYGI